MVGVARAMVARAVVAVAKGKVEEAVVA